MNAFFYNSKDFERESKRTRPAKTIAKAKKVNELELNKEYIKKNKGKELDVRKASDLS